MLSLKTCVTESPYSISVTKVFLVVFRGLSIIGFVNYFYIPPLYTLCLFWRSTKKEKWSYSRTRNLVFTSTSECRLSCKRQKSFVCNNFILSLSLLLFTGWLYYSTLNVFLFNLILINLVFVDNECFNRMINLNVFAGQMYFDRNFACNKHFSKTW